MKGERKAIPQNFGGLEWGGYSYIRQEGIYLLTQTELLGVRGL